MVENMRLRALGLDPRLKRKSVHDRLGELQPRSLKDILGTREVDRGQEREHNIREGTTSGKSVETKTCDRCDQKGHLRRTCTNLKRPKNGGEAAPVAKHEPNAERIASSVVNGQPRARTAALDRVLPFATMEHRT